MVFEIIAGIVTLLFAILVFYLVKVLKEMQVFLRSTRITLERVEAETESIKQEIIPLFRNSSDLIEKVHDQVNEFDPILKSVSDIGHFINDHTHKPTDKKKTRWQDTMSDILDLTNVSLRVFQQFQQRSGHEKKHR